MSERMFENLANRIISDQSAGFIRDRWMKYGIYGLITWIVKWLDGHDYITVHMDKLREDGII